MTRRCPDCHRRTLVKYAGRWTCSNPHCTGDGQQQIPVITSAMTPFTLSEPGCLELWADDDTDDTDDTPGAA